MKKVIYGIVVAMGLLGSSIAFAQGDAAAGKAKSMVCSACHGSNGIAAIPGYPDLKGQNEQYLINALTAYKNGQRAGGYSNIMQIQAKLLSEQDIKNLAAYYANLK